MRHNRKHVFLTLIFFLLCCTACGAGNTASIRLSRTEGSVKINNKGKDITPSEGLKLYNGYEVKTEPAAYAWMELDASRLAKMDSESQVQIQKEGKHLDILVSQGSLFFNIEESLNEDETLSIHTSSMMVGIRGTCGWVTMENPEHMKVYLLEGTVSCRIESADADANDVSISAWQMADMQLKNGKGIITVNEFTSLDIPSFVAEELEPLSQSPDIEQSDHTDVSAVLTMPVTAQEIQDLWNGGTKNITILPGEDNNVLTIDTNFKDSSGNYAFIEDYGLLMASGNFTAAQEIISECYFAPVQNATADALICGEHGYFFNAGELIDQSNIDREASDTPS